jgi:hypothetical protein
MNLTLAVDDKLVEKAREVAARQGTSLQALVRQYIETLAGSREATSLVEQLEEHWRDADKHLKEHPARSYTFNREELYEGRVARRRRGR